VKEDEAFSVSVASLVPIYEGAHADRTVSELYLEHHFKSEHPNDEAITSLILVHSLVSSQCKTIEAFVRDSEEAIVTLYPSEIKALLISSVAAAKAKQELSNLNISFFLH
jgi:hypothetical protein